MSFYQPRKFAASFCRFGEIISGYASLHFPAFALSLKRRCFSAEAGLKLALLFTGSNGFELAEIIVIRNLFPGELMEVPESTYF